MSAVVPLAGAGVAFDAERRGALDRLTTGLDAAQLQWLSGYFAGRASALPSTVVPAPAPAPVAAPAELVLPRLTIVYGSHTGNGKRLAERLARDAEGAGLAPRLFAADQYPLRELATERLLYVLISTHGDGDPPDSARAFVEFLGSRRAPGLPELAYAVLALGDSSYPKFCATGRVVDERLAALGARRAFDRVECDLDFDRPAGDWLARALREASARAPAATVTPLRATVPPAAPATTRERPFAAEVLANQRITGRDGWRDVRHVELSLAGSGLTYEPGDSLGVWPTNADPLVDEWLQVLRLDGGQPVSHDGTERPLRDWLRNERELTRLARPFLTRHAGLGKHAALEHVLQAEAAPQLAALLRDRAPIDLLREFESPWAGQDLVAALRPLTPRLYSIASSPRVAEDEAHLTVALLEHELFGRTRRGAASAFLGARNTGGDTAPVFVESNPRFRLPADGATDLILIGAGTGVAPYRAFVQDRAATGASGRQWLLFGAPRRHADFLYQLEWLQALRNGTLHKLTPAFSRDQRDKFYVQHALRENGRELYAWLERGASVYVCGDATRMAPDVHAALVDIVATHGGVEREAAAERVESWLADGRYRRDVY
jgi:sulfite reductase (NADPH) flavoprotein alpha-component